MIFNAACVSGWAAIGCGFGVFVGLTILEVARLMH